MDQPDNHDLDEIGRIAGELRSATGDGGREAALLEIATLALRSLGKLRTKRPQQIGFAPGLRIKADRRDTERDR